MAVVLIEKKLNIARMKNKIQMRTVYELKFCTRLPKTFNIFKVKINISKKY